jgi:hypothetical protein
MSAMAGAEGALSGTNGSERSVLLLWMIFTGLSIFAVFLLWRYGLIHLMVVSDRTYISHLYIEPDRRSLPGHLRPLLLAHAGDCARRRGRTTLPRHPVGA